MYDQLFPDAAEQSYSAKLLRPVEPQSPKFSTWGFLSAAPKGIAAGAVQAMASTADVGNAIADKLPANIQGPFGKIPIIAGIQSVMQAGADMLQPKEWQFTSEIGTSLRNVARDYMPDPLTTHASERVVADLFRVGSKAITAAVTMGNIPGAVVAGAEEGFTMADDLSRQGVDVQTRTKVGALNAALNAGAFALPVAGNTWAQTAALALAGGPTAFVVQNSATRKILQDADYTRQADQYDPSDPVGLTLSTVVPLGFGALAMRGRAKAKTVSPDVEDAARVSLLRQNVDQANPVPDRMDLAESHVQAYARAMDQMAEGRRVEVSDVAPRIEIETRPPVIETPEFRNWFGDSKVVDEQGKPMVVYHGTTADFDTFQTQRGSEGVNDTAALYFTRNPDYANEYTYRTGPGTADYTGGNIMPVYLQVKNPKVVEGTLDSAHFTPDEVAALRAQGYDGVINKAGDEIAVFGRDQIKSAIGNSGKFDPNSASLTDSKFSDWVQQVNSTLDEMRSEMARMRQTGPDQPVQPKPVEKTPQKPETAKSQQAQSATKSVADNGPARAAEPNAPRSQEVDAGRTGSTDADAYVQAEAQRIAAENPDMPVLLEGMDSPAPLSEVMARIEQELQADLADVPLLKVAAECFIQSGAGVV